MKRIFLVLISFVCLFSAFSKSSSSNNKTNVPFYVSQENVSLGTDPGADPEVIRERLEALNFPMEMRYTDEIQKYIDSYLKTGRRSLATIKVLSEYYLPIFEKALAEAGLPDELKYIPIIESGLDPKATSHCGAGGLWQIMPSVAKGYDMRVNSSIDERRDPYIASERACRMLKKAYEKFGDWGLAIASYNCGSGTLGKALKRAGGDSKEHNFWTVANYLPAQTRHYVPKFIAMVYIMEYYAEHNFPELTKSTFAADTICVSEKVNLSKIASKYNVGISDLKALNPQFHTDVVPGSATRLCNIILPANAAMAYKMNRANPGMMNDDDESQPMIAEVATKPVVSTPAKATATATNKNQTKNNPNSIDYEDVESPSMPGTFMRVPRTNKVKNNKPGKKQNEEIDDESTFGFITNMRKG